MSQRKFQTQLRERQVTELFYRDGHTTICLLVTPAHVVLSRGVVICSGTDKYIRRVGRNKASGMAMHALIYHRTIDLPIILSPNPASERAYSAFGYKATFMPILHNYEKDLVEQMRKRDERAAEKASSAHKESE